MKINNITSKDVTITITHQQAGLIASWATFMTNRDLILNINLENKEIDPSKDLIEPLTPFMNDDE